MTSMATVSPDHPSLNMCLPHALRQLVTGVLHHVLFGQAHISESHCFPSAKHVLALLACARLHCFLLLHAFALRQLLLDGV